jgi:hypothetical protein
MAPAPVPPMILRYLRRETKYVTDRFHDFSQKYPSLPEDYVGEFVTFRSLRGHIAALTTNDFTLPTPPTNKRLALVRVCDDCLRDIEDMMQTEDVMAHYDASTVNDDVVDAIDDIRECLLVGILPPVTNPHPGQGPILGPPMIEATLGPPHSTQVEGGPSPTENPTLDDGHDGQHHG